MSAIPESNDAPEWWQEHADELIEARDVIEKAMMSNGWLFVGGGFDLLIGNTDVTFSRGPYRLIIRMGFDGGPPGVMYGGVLDTAKN